MLGLNLGHLAPYFFRTLRRKNRGQVLILMYHKLCSVILLHIPCSSSAASTYTNTSCSKHISKSKESIEFVTIDRILSNISIENLDPNFPSFKISVISFSNEIFFFTLLKKKFGRKIWNRKKLGKIFPILHFVDEEKIRQRPSQVQGPATTCS